MQRNLRLNHLSLMDFCLFTIKMFSNYMCSTTCT